MADYRCVNQVGQKIKKSRDTLQLQLEKNPDILRDVAAADNPPFTVGFAAETEQLAEHARQKLQEKKLDLIAANLVGEQLGFDDVDNTLEVFWQDGTTKLPLASKDKLARQLLQVVAEHYHNKHSGTVH